jgi:hypothetical protein
MEGIIAPLPWTAARATLSVPYLSQALYQPRSSSFESFLQHYGFQRADHAGDLIHGCETIASLTVFLQSWLFFGLLSAFLERDINREDFVTGDVVDINQEAVHVYFRDWRVSLSRFSYTARRKKQERIQMLLQAASLKSDVFEEAADFLGPNHDDFDRVILSVKLLVSLLSAIADDTFAVINPPPSRLWAPWVTAVASCIVRSHPTAIQWFKVPDEYLSESLAVIGEQEARRHLHSQPNRFRPYPPGAERGGRAAERLLRIFIDNGWCPYRALNLCQSYDYLILNSLASLIHNPPVAENHQHCLELQKCTAHNLMVDGPTEYPFQHVDEPHDCEFVGVTRDQIAEIIKSDQIPLISMSLEGDLDLQVVQCTPYTTYTAISHVWSDGLGNPYSNALPRCQLLRLRRLISETYFAKYSPFYDDSTFSSQFASTLYWEFWRLTRASKPYYKVDKKRVYFWMDTLCIPVSADLQMAEEDRDLKFRAMKHITPVFAGAFTTLVLDRGLQTVQLQEPSQVSGDEFAAIILSSKWMQRGWTLEEGVLSSTCVFQMMDKPYEISGSLNRLMPKLGAQRSPLERVSINVRRLMPLVLKRALVDEKKKLSSDALASRAKRLTKLLRVPQFTWTWNSLLHRSMTKEQDGPIILANLVDFNVSGLKFVAPEERLKLLIQSCNELPLSLLYNTGPRVSIKGHPELGWIPRSISGDHIVSGAAFRRITTKRTDNHVKFFIDRQDSDPESFLVLETPPGQCIPYDTATFVVRARIGIHGNLVQEYVVEIQRSLCEGLDDEDARSFDRQLYQQAQGTCIAMDLACGTSSWRGISGKGVRFYVDSHQRKQMNLKYDAPLIIRTAEQWQRTYNRHQASLPCFDMTYVRRSQRLLLKYGKRSIPRRSSIMQTFYCCKTENVC